MSAARPYFAISQPRPPPSVSPAMPVVEIAPPVTARPCSRGRVVELRPAEAALRSHRARRRGRPRCPSSRRGRSSRAPSATARPATLWPPPRTQMSSPAARAKRTPAETSAALRQRTITAGERSIEAVVDAARRRRIRRPRGATRVPETWPARSSRSAGSGDMADGTSDSAAPLSTRRLRVYGVRAGWRGEGRGARRVDVAAQPRRMSSRSGAERVAQPRQHLAERRQQFLVRDDAPRRTAHARRHRREVERLETRPGAGRAVRTPRAGP